MTIPGSPASAPQENAELMVMAPGQPPRGVPLPERQFTLGRAAGNELCYPDDAGLSRQHLVIERIGEDFVVRDLGSKNGTLVNGERLTSPHVLRSGDQISAGHLLIEFRAPLPDPLQRTVLFVERTHSAPEESSTVVSANLEAVLRQEKATPAGTKTVDALIRVGQELAGHRPLDELFPLILNLAIESVGASRGVLLTLEGANLVPRAAAGDNFRISTTVRDRVINKRESILVSDISLDLELAQRQSIVAQAVRSVMAVPLQTRENVIGLIYVDATNALNPFTRDDLNLLTVMANVAAIRIEHARLVEVEQQERVMARELAQAAEIHTTLLPAAPPAVPGWDLAAVNVPCRSVGGDYFDFIQGASGKLLLVVGDVAGKGMPAALMMSSLQAYLRVLGENPEPLAHLVARLNQLVATRCPPNRFITLFAALLDPDTGELRYVNAGHNAALVVRRDGGQEWLSEGGVILGPFPRFPYEENRLLLHEGDLLVLYSDGVSEATHAETEEEFGPDRLAAVFRDSPPGAGAELISRLMESLRQWCGHRGFEDDVTVLAARRIPLEVAEPERIMEEEAVLA